MERPLFSLVTEDYWCDIPGNRYLFTIMVWSWCENACDEGAVTASWDRSPYTSKYILRTKYSAVLDRWRDTALFCVRSPGHVVYPPRDKAIYRASCLIPGICEYGLFFYRCIGWKYPIITGTFFSWQGDLPVDFSVVLSRGTIANRTYGTPKNLPGILVYVYLFLLARGTIVNRTKYCY